MSNEKTLSTIRFSKEISGFIENQGNKEENYFHFPFYFKKVGDCLFEIAQFNEANGELKHIVERSENPNPEGDEQPIKGIW